MQEVDIETVAFGRSPVTHFVEWIDGPWAGHSDAARTFCGRIADANKVEPRKFSAVRSWCLTCYHARRKAINKDVARKAIRYAVST